MTQPTSTVALTALCLLASLWLIQVTVTRLRDPLNKVPGPWHAKWTSWPLKLATLSGHRIYYVHSLHEKYGSYVRLSPNEVGINESSGFKQVHGINSGFTKSKWYSDLLSIGRPILFTMADNKAHGARRRLFAKAFSKSNIRENWSPIVKKKIQLAVQRMESQADAVDDGVVDILKWWTFMASDVSAHLMFGESFHTLEGGESNEYLQTLQTGLVGMGVGAELPLVRTIGRMLPFRATRQLFAVNEYLTDYARTALKTMKSSYGGKNIFAEIVKEAEKGASLDEIDVQLEATGLIIAGTDTTAVTLTYLIWVVLSRPELQRTLRDELATVSEDPQDADLEALPLLNAVIEETLRLYGALPGALPRTVPTGGVTINGYFLPQGTTASTQSYSLHREPQLFPNPDRFEVSRWLTLADSHEKYGLTSSAKSVFSPWGAGSRTCLGQHIAYMELRFAAAEFLRAFPNARLAASTTDACMEMENFFLIRPGGHKCEVVLR